MENAGKPPRVCVAKGDKVKKYQRIAEADGFVSAEYVWAYPPGIPLVVPGEMITDQMLAALAAMQSRGTELHSTNGQKPEQMPHALRVVSEE